MSKWLKFAHLAQTLAPIIITIAAPELAPLAATIAHGISLAEAMPGASGAQKLASVKALAADAAEGINQAHGSQVVDVTKLNDAVESGVNTTVAILNMLVKDPATVVK